MLKPRRAQESMRACNAQLPEGLICPMRDVSSPSHALSKYTVLYVSAQRCAALYRLSWDTVFVACAASIYAAAGAAPRSAALGRSGMPCAECTMLSVGMGSSQSAPQDHAVSVDRQDEMVFAGSHIAWLSRLRSVGRPKVKRRTSRQIPTCTSCCLLWSREASDGAQIIHSPASVSTRNMHQTP